MWEGKRDVVINTSNRLQDAQSVQRRCDSSWAITVVDSVVEMQRFLAILFLLVRISSCSLYNFAFIIQASPNSTYHIHTCYYALNWFASLLTAVLPCFNR